MTDQKRIIDLTTVYDFPTPEEYSFNQQDFCEIFDYNFNCEKCMTPNLMNILYEDFNFFKNSFKDVKQTIIAADSWQDFSKKYYPIIYKFSFAVGQPGDELIFGSRKSFYDGMALFYKGYLIGFFDKLPKTS